MRTLILGGVKSGKSAYAEQIAGGSNAGVRYIATARANDEAMAERIRLHRARRPSHWQTVECSGDLAATLQQGDGGNTLQLVDCLTLWLTALIEEPASMDRETEALLTTLPGLQGDVVMVANEVGLGVVPMGAISRRFVDAAGRLHQRLAGVSERVVFVTAGLPQTLKVDP